MPERIQITFLLLERSILTPGGGGGGVLPYMGYIGMCRCEGYGFQAVYSGIARIYNLESLGLEQGIIFQETDQY